MTTTIHTNGGVATAPGPLPGPRTTGETSESPQRSAQRMHGTALAFDLAAQGDLLRQEASWQRGDRNAKTLVKEPGFRVVLVAMKAGARLAEHAAHEQATVQLLTGHLRIRLTDKVVDVPAGDLVALDAMLGHEVEAVEESVFLLTIATAQEASRAPSASTTATAASRQHAGATHGAETWADDGGNQRSAAP